MREVCTGLIFLLHVIERIKDINDTDVSTTLFFPQSLEDHAFFEYTEVRQELPGICLQLSFEYHLHISTFGPVSSPPHVTLRHIYVSPYVCQVYKVI